MKAPRESTADERREMHREKMRIKAFVEQERETILMAFQENGTEFPHGSEGERYLSGCEGAYNKVLRFIKGEIAAAIRKPHPSEQEQGK